MLNFEFEEESIQSNKKQHLNRSQLNIYSIIQYANELEEETRSKSLMCCEHREHGLEIIT